jgi:hypothetical protein
VFDAGRLAFSRDAHGLLQSVVLNQVFLTAKGMPLRRQSEKEPDIQTSLLVRYRLPRVGAKLVWPCRPRRARLLNGALPDRPSAL